MKTQTTIRVEESTHKEAKKILSEIGLNYSQAIAVFNRLIVLNQGLPFYLKIPKHSKMDFDAVLKDMEKDEN